MIKKEFITHCSKGYHDLIEIYRANNSLLTNAEDVVRWCNICGAIVVDIEIDGKLVGGPGNYLKMMGPMICGEDDER